MKAEKFNALIWWAEWKDINPDSDIDSMYMYRECSDNLLDWELYFDLIDDKSDWEYIMCTCYVNDPDKEWYSAVINRDCVWWFDTPEAFAKYVAGLYDRAMEIKWGFNS